MCNSTGIICCNRNFMKVQVEASSNKKMQQQTGEDVLKQLSENRKRRRRTALLSQTRERTSNTLPTGSLEEPAPKRQKVEENEEASTSTSSEKKEFSHLLEEVNDDLLNSYHFSTVNLALQKLKSLCIGLPVPLMLKHMIHAMLAPNMQTQIEHELDELLSAGIIRQFQFHHLGPTAVAYCYTEDLIDYIRRYVDSLTTGALEKLNSPKKSSTQLLPTFQKQQQQLTLNRQKQSNERLKILADKFISNLLPQYTDTVISQDHLKHIMECSDADIPLLMKLGLFTIKDKYDFYFNIPSAGQFIMDVQKGREELQSILRRKKYKEMMLHTLHERQLKKSSLSIIWHIREMLGLGVVEITETSNGKMVVLK